MNINQKAFSAVEVLIVVAIVGSVGAVGWLVYDRQSSQELSTTTQTITQKSAPTSEVEKQTSVEEPQQKYLELKEWDVKLPLSDGVSLRYTLNGNTAKIRSAELDTLSGSCVTNSITVVRGLASETVPKSTGEGGSTFSEVYGSTTADSMTTRSFRAKVGDYYFIAPGYSGASCVDIPYIEPEGKAKNDAELKSSLDIVKAINQLVQM